MICTPLSTQYHFHNKYLIFITDVTAIVIHSRVIYGCLFKVYASLLNATMIVKEDSKRLWKQLHVPHSKTLT